MEIEGRKAGPYATAVELKTAEPESHPIEPKPGAQSRWVKPLSCYERRSRPAHG